MPSSLANKNSFHNYIGTANIAGLNRNMAIRTLSFWYHILFVPYHIRTLGANSPGGLFAPRTCIQFLPWIIRA